MNNQNKHLVFVYGTLKKGYGNHRLLELSSSKHIADAMTFEAKYTMESLGGCPGVYKNGDEAIWGEVYEVSDLGLKSLDSLEGNGCLYTRELVDVVNSEGEKYKAWMYMLPHDDDDFRNYCSSESRKVNIEVVEINEIKVSNWNKDKYPEWSELVSSSYNRHHYDFD